MSTKTFSRADIKIIAFIAMLCDHLATAVISGHGGRVWSVLHLLGRIAMPLYAFLIAEGLHRTGNRKKYALRLLILALASTVPYSLLFYGTWFYIKDLNVVFGFAVGVVAVTITDLAGKTKGQTDFFARILVMIAACLVSIVLNVNYLFLPVLLICVFYYFREESEKKIFFAGVLLTAGELLVNILLICMEGFAWESLFRQALTATEWDITALVSLLLIQRYDGRNGKCLPGFYYYISYPGHMLLLLLIRLLINC